MRRIANALREWMQLRRRLREERRFHIENAAAEYRVLGMSPRTAMRQARSRFGGRRHVNSALRELGGDFPGLCYLLSAHRVSASPWLQPVSLLAAAALILLVSPAARLLIEGVIGTPLVEEDRRAVTLMVAGWNPAERVISSQDFEIIRALPGLSGVQRYRSNSVQARAARGVTLDAIQSEVRARTGHRIFAGYLFSESRVVTGPALAIWVLLWFYVMFSLLQCLPSRGRVGWLLYGLVTAFLHALVSLMVWALAMQVWNWTPALFSLLFIAYMLSAAMQCRLWLRDLNQRCPMCLERLVLPITEGTPDRVLLESPITESLCAHGHGVLVESRWSRRFRPEESPLHGLVRA